tara:strand:- start:488 stop:697 length:210 start_codon:yes stop_codon:yes gene_type:complete
LLKSVPGEDLDPPPLLTGDDLKAAGLSPGPLFKTLLQSIRDAQLDQDVGDRDQALNLFHEIRGRHQDDE